jgi:hypothetical protein
LIEVIGHPGSSEYEAAVSISEALVNLWPGVDSSPQAKDHVIISAGVKISGYPVSDIDVVIVGVFNPGRTFTPTRIMKDRQGKKYIKKPVTVRNFIAAIEVKDHDQRSIKIIGDAVEVYYSRGASTGWHNATEQNDKQLHSLRYYFRDKYVDGPWVYRSLLMRGLSHIDMPGALPRSFTGEEFLTSIASLSKVENRVDGLRFASGEQQDVTRILSLPIFKAVVPSGLDRKRMDLILKETPQTQELVDLLGHKMVRLRGQGGTGKTVMLLQAAWRKFSDRGERTLILTYNRALAADIRRLLTLLGVPSNPGDGGIAVHTVMSFMYSWFKRLQLLDEDEEASFDDYPAHCAAATDLLAGGAISAKDIQAVLKEFPEKFDFDYVVVDESQDWPQAEADLLKALYAPVRIAIGDGVDQLVRGARTDWDRGVDESDREVISLDTTLRMKSNLSGFVQSISNEVGLPWEPQPSDKSGGGHLFLASGPASSQLGLLKELTESAKSLGNAEVDFLFCVPPGAVVAEGALRKSEVGIALGELGFEVWDGVDPQLRKDYPVSKKQYRVVQYDSCRGLEGWTVVLDRLDEAWCHYRDQRHSQGLSEQEAESFRDLDEVASTYAWQRVLIALCRPIDTLVITLGNLDNECARVIKKIAKQKDGFVTFVD